MYGIQTLHGASEYAAEGGAGLPGLHGSRGARLRREPEKSDFHPLGDEP